LYKQRNRYAHAQADNMLQLYKHEHGRPRKYLPSGQTHVLVADVEDWIQKAADDKGRIQGVFVEIHSTAVRLSDAAEAHIVAALYAADHNDYVTRNLGYPPELTASEDEASDIESASGTDDEVHEHLEKLEFDYEQNEELEVNEFGPSHAKDSNW
jgi:hypothetical protein